MTFQLWKFLNNYYFVQNIINYYLIDDVGNAILDQDGDYIKII